MSISNNDAVISRGEIVAAADAIEPLPASLTRLLRLMNDDAFEMNDLVETLTHDPTLAGDVLGRANSTASGSRRHIGDLREAVTRIGTREVVAIAMRRAVKSQFNVALPAHGLDADDLWRHSIAASVAGELIRSRSITPIAPMISTTALIHDIGKLVIAQCVPPGALKLLGDAAEREQLAIHEAEKTVLGIDHAEIGGFVARTWGLPVSVQVALIQHHVPRSDDVFTHALILADRLSHAAMSFTEMTTPDTDEEEALAIAKGLVPDVRTHTAICGFDPIDLPATIIQVATETESILNDYA